MEEILKKLNEKESEILVFSASKKKEEKDSIIAIHKSGEQLTISDPSFSEEMSSEKVDQLAGVVKKIAISHFLDKLKADLAVVVASSNQEIKELESLN